MVENAALTEMPSDELLEQRIDRYLDEHWEDIVDDIDRLVRLVLAQPVPNKAG